VSDTLDPRHPPTKLSFFVVLVIWLINFIGTSNYSESIPLSPISS